MAALRFYVAPTLVAFGVVVACLTFGAEKKPSSIGEAAALSCEDKWGLCRQACKNEDGRLLQAACKRDCDDAYTACITKEGVIKRTTSGAKRGLEATSVTSPTPRNRLPKGTEPVVGRSPSPTATPAKRLQQVKDAGAVTAEASATPKRKPTPTPSPNK